MLKVDTTNLGNVALLCVQGRLVRGETEALRKAVLSERSASAVVLDLSQVSIIDGGGLGVMLELREDTESRGTEFRLRNVSKLVRQVLAITRLDSVFKLTTEKQTSYLPMSCRSNATFQAAACA